MEIPKNVNNTRPFKDLEITKEILQTCLNWEEVGWIKLGEIQEVKDKLAKVIPNNAILLVYKDMHTISREIYREMAFRRMEVL